MKQVLVGLVIINYPKIFEMALSYGPEVIEVVIGGRSAYYFGATNTEGIAFTLLERYC